MNACYVLILCCALAVAANGLTQDTERAMMSATIMQKANPASAQAFPIAVTSAASGDVSLLDRGDLKLIRMVLPNKPGSSPGPMLVAEDKIRRVFYVGNFNGGVGRIPMDAGKATSLDLNGTLIGLSISPDGRYLNSWSFSF